MGIREESRVASWFSDALSYCPGRSVMPGKATGPFGGSGDVVATRLIKLTDIPAAPG